MLKIYIVRHGQTTWNSEHRLQGRQNSNLTPLGQEQAKRLGEYLVEEDIKIDHYLSSPQQRAYETAKFIARDREVIIRDDLAEIGFGTWEGRRLEEVKKENPDQFYNFFNEAHLYDSRVNDGESFEELEKRVRRELDYLTSTYKDKTILLVSHGITIKIIFSIIKNHSLKEFWTSEVFANSSLSLVNFENGKFKVDYISSTDFLDADMNTSWSKNVK